MKRHEALAPLSREHHQALILAQLLKKNAPVYKGLPELANEKASYATAFFNTDLKLHFVKEEAVFGLVMLVSPEIETVIKELIDEHRVLTALFHSLGEQAAPPVNTMNRLGELLDSHIRKEERVLFPLLQKYCTNDELRKIGELL